ncbi:hypothetical protein [Bacillus haynesii]|uniref:hypothetical protein n=1 Tax=Bacillus haynesii TaxID=1925021 RepID=UPI002282C7A1|nr:hypothetical protein [Bacillus haynesii]MCY7861636.1 hypothetical protein [Bacillus haynesii]MEC0763176.1 hypothetical protein [Bacillus haynesii]
MVEEKYEELQRYAKLVTSSQFLERKIFNKSDKGMVEGFSSQLDRLEDYLKAIR